MWEYLGIKINITSDGLFEYEMNDEIHYTFSLVEAKREISERTDLNYHYFSKSDLQTMIGKLDDRESKFIKDVLTELNLHGMTIECDRGVKIKWNWNNNF